MNHSGRWTCTVTGISVWAVIGLAGLLQAQDSPCHERSPSFENSCPSYADGPNRMLAMRSSSNRVCISTRPVEQRMPPNNCVQRTAAAPYEAASRS